MRWPAPTPLRHAFFPINQLIRLLQLPYAVLNLPVDAALPCLFPRRGRVSTLFFIDSSKNLVWNARKTVGAIVDAKRAIV